MEAVVISLPSSAGVVRYEPRVSETDLIRSICKKSYYHFFKEFWGTINAEPLVDNFHIRFLCDKVQGIMERIFAGLPREADVIVNVPPGMSKSTIFSIMLCPWAWTRMPHCRFICASHTHDLVLFLSRKSRDVVESGLYTRCFPEIELRNDQNTKGHFENTAGGMRFCCTVGGKTPVGMHSHVSVSDDPIDPQRAVEAVALKTANRFHTAVLPQRRISSAISVMILVMQRLNEDDPTGHLLSKPRLRFTHFCMPDQLSDNLRPSFLKRFYERQGGYLDPLRLDADILREKLDLLGEYDYAGQYGQRPVPIAGGMFKVGKFRYSDLDLADRDFDETIRYWDKAGTQDGGAYSAGVKLGKRLIGWTERVPSTKYHPAIEPRPIYEWWVRDVERGQWGTDEREEVIYSTAQRDGRGVRQAVEQEPGSGGKHSAEFTVSALAGWRTDIDLPTGKKDVRAGPFSSQVNIGRVVLVRGEWNNAYVDEFRHFPRGKFKDQVDGTSGAFKMISDPKIMITSLA